MKDKIEVSLDFPKHYRALQEKGKNITKKFYVPLSNNSKKLNKVTIEMKKRIRAQKKSAFSDTIQLRIKDDPKQFCKHVKRNGEETTAILSIISNDSVLFEDKDKTEFFNKYFVCLF